MRRLFQVVSGILRLLGNNTTTNLYVAKTGSDSNPGTSALPFLTIQAAIDYVAAGLFPGNVIINIGDGTYSENIIAKGMMGKTTYATTGSTTIPLGQSMITLLGDATTPGDVIIVGSGAGAATFSMENCHTQYTVNGVEMRNVSTKPAFYVSGYQSQLTVTNVSSSLVLGFMTVAFGARMFYANGSAGGTHALAGGNFILATTFAYVRIDRGLTVTGVAISVVNALRGAYVQFNTTGQAYSFSANSASGASAFASNSSSIVGFGSGDTIAINNRSAPVFRCTGTNGGGSYVIQGGATFNMTDCTGGACRIDQGGIYAENAASTWNYLGTSVATYSIYDGSMSYSFNNFTSAVPTFVVQDTDFKFGADWRYQDITSWNIAGAVVVGNTGYVTHNAQQADYLPTYIAQQDCVVDKLQVRSRVANGAGQSDVYTLMKNGVDTTMVVTVTNGLTASTTTNPVVLAADDYLSLKLVSAAATTAEDVLIQAVIRKT